MSKANTRRTKQGQRSDQAAKKRRERRFTPEPSRTSYATLGAGMLGAGVLGAGVWAVWVSERQPPWPAGPYLVAAGAVALAAALWLGDIGAGPVRVGDAGIAVERGTDLVRLAWCDIERLSVQGRKLVIRGADVTLTLPMDAHRRAVAWVLSEAAQRLPDIVDVKPSVVDTLPRPHPADAPQLEVPTVQVTGRHCAASDQPISFERDARLCPKCGQVYHRDRVPDTCVTCHAALGREAIPV
jgi:hypothetical protein